MVRYIGVDTGGTFTDLVEMDGEGKVSFEKAFSTPAAPEQGVLDVLEHQARQARVTPERLLEDTARFAHGTTISTNALIQRRGARVGLITTRGFEDTLFIARGPTGRTGGVPLSRAMDFIRTEPAVPLVDGGLIRGIGERVAVTGEVLAPLDEAEAERAIRELLEAGMESLAVCLLWSFRHPAHEEQVRMIANRLAPGLSVSLSAEIAPRLGEFERMVTTVINAFVGPVTERYIGNLQASLSSRGLARPVQVMKSHGGLTLPDAVARQAVSVVNSGPIGGLVAARYLGHALGHPKIITADTGGTSFDVGLVVDGVFEEESQPFLDQGLPVLIPSVKVVTIGAGGGSIASTDGYRLYVGPRSAGSVPGPACYGRGGEEPTVTDALVVLGIIDPNNFFGGRYTLDRERAREAVEGHVARPLGLNVIEAAASIYEVITARMADLIRKVTVESGYDPKEFTLLSYGGASGAHCANFSAQLGIGRIIIPYAGPVFSALGIALSDVIYSHGRSEPVLLEQSEQVLEKIKTTLAELQERAMADMAASGIDRADVTMRYRIEMRYQGQMNEISLPWERAPLVVADLARLQDAFESYYHHKYGAGTTRRATPLELISFRAEAIRVTEKPKLVPLFADERSVNGPAAPAAIRPVYQHGRGWVDAGIYPFESLRPGIPVSGPAVIERDNTTVWLPPDTGAVLDVYGNIEIDLRT